MITERGMFADTITECHHGGRLSKTTAGQWRTQIPSNAFLRPIMDACGGGWMPLERPMVRDEVMGEPVSIGQISLSERI